MPLVAVRRCVAISQNRRQAYVQGIFRQRRQITIVLTPGVVSHMANIPPDSKDVAGESTWRRAEPTSMSRLPSHWNLHRHRCICPVVSRPTSHIRHFSLFSPPASSIEISSTCLHLPFLSTSYSSFFFLPWNTSSLPFCCSSIPFLSINHQTNTSPNFAQAPRIASPRPSRPASYAPFVIANSFAR